MRTLITRNGLRGGAVALGLLGSCLTLAACGMAGANGAATAPPSSQPDPWSAIPVAVLAKQQVTMTQSSASAGIDQQTAERVALGGVYPGSQVRNAILVSLRDAGRNLTCTCWIVSLKPAGDTTGEGPMGSAHLRANYWITAVDASSGAIVDQILGRDASLPDLPPPTRSPSPSGS